MRGSPTSGGSNGCSLADSVRACDAGQDPRLSADPGASRRGPGEAVRSISAGLTAARRSRWRTTFADAPHRAPTSSADRPPFLGEPPERLELVGRVHARPG